MVRYKNRFLLAELIWKDGRLDESLTEAGILAVLRDSIASNFGDFGLGVCLASMQVKYYNSLTNMCIVRCGREQFNEVCTKCMAWEFNRITNLSFNKRINVSSSS